MIEIIGCFFENRLKVEAVLWLDGIEQGLQPGPMTEGNGYEAEDAEPLPADMATAVGLAKDSDWLKDVIGEDRLTIFMQQAERELEFVGSQVTPVETERYLVNF